MKVSEIIQFVNSFERAINFRCVNELCLKRHFSFDGNNTLLLRSGDITIFSHQMAEEFDKMCKSACIIDLRSTPEIEAKGIGENLINAGIDRISFPLKETDSSFKNVLFPDWVDYYQYYQSMLCSNIGIFVDILSFISECAYKQIIVSCYAGKDRTGIVSALVLAICGVPRPDILRDYVLSGDYLMSSLQHFRGNWEKRGLTAYQYKMRLRPQAETMAKLLDFCKDNFGGVRNMLASHGFKAKNCKILSSRFCLQVNSLGE